MTPNIEDHVAPVGLEQDGVPKMSQQTIKEKSMRSRVEWSRLVQGRAVNHGLTNKSDLFRPKNKTKPFLAFRWKKQNL